jgi:hypothetical protein
MLMMIYMTRIQNMSFFLLKINNPSVRHPVSPVGPPSGPVGHPVWPPRLATRRAPPLAPVGHPVRPRLATPVWPPRLATRRAWLSRGCFQTDGRTDNRTMAAGASVTWMHCSVLFEVTWG